ncbi:MAG: hypothetical protein K2Q32_01270, partial [Alphaproteobacteria bacterium]|nr:hypothetical protein [Alphaproteobacteria bacterium]
KFDESILVTTADPCGSCTRVLIELGVGEVITDAQRFSFPMKDNRLAEMAKSAQRLDENGVKHRHVLYHFNI